MKQSDKSKIVEEFRGELETASAAFVTQYRGMTVAEMMVLRGRIRAAGGSYRVVKNTLAKRAAQGTRFQALDPFLTGPTAIAWGSDPAAPAKALADYAKENPKLVLVGGVLDGKTLRVEEIHALAKLPSREVLLAQLMGVMKGPLQGLVNVLNGVPRALVRALDQVRQQKEGAEA